MKNRRAILSASLLTMAGAAGAATAGVAASPRPAADEALVALAREGLAVHQRWVDRLAECDIADDAFLAARAGGQRDAALEARADEARAAEVAVSDEFSAVVDRAIEIPAATAQGVVAKAALQWLAEFAGSGGPGSVQDERLAYAVAADAFRLMGFAEMEGGAA